MKSEVIRAINDEDSLCCAEFLLTFERQVLSPDDIDALWSR